MKYVKIILILLLFIATLLGGRMFWQGKKSASMTPKILGVENGKLNACGQKPNCVSSAAEPASDFYIKPLAGRNIESLWDDLNMHLPDLGFVQTETTEENYMHFTDTSRVFGFVDDLEFLLKPEEGVIHMRSQSRVGYSDLGANRKRLEKIRTTLLPK